MLRLNRVLEPTRVVRLTYASIASLLQRAMLIVLTAIGMLCSANANCASDIEVPKVVFDARVVVLGEVHGTTQAPAFAAALLCALAQPTVPVLLALEIPNDQQSAIDAFVGGGPSADFERHNSKARFWSRSFQDGRSSAAMITLIEAARTIRASGADIQVLAFDRGEEQLDPALTRNEVMAKNILSGMEKRSGLKVLVLTGQVHAKKSVGASFDSQFKSTTYLLSRANVLSFQMRSTGGEAWVCSAVNCGVRSGWASPSAVLGRSGLVLDGAVQPDFDGYFDVGRITPSPPAYTPTSSKS